MSSTTVSNPYSFNIVSNTSLSVTIESPLPEDPTVLWSIALSSVSSTETASLTIPAGVKVLNVIAATLNDNSGFLGAISVGSNTPWISGRLNGWGDSLVSMVGVTPDKTYTLKCTGLNVIVQAVYSKQLNTFTPDITDYIVN